MLNIFWTKADVKKKKNCINQSLASFYLFFLKECQWIKLKLHVKDKEKIVTLLNSHESYKWKGFFVILNPNKTLQWLLFHIVCTIFQELLSFKKSNH